MKKLLFVAATVTAVVLAVAPVSMAGEDDPAPGPTQSGEVLATPPAPESTPTPASNNSGSRTTASNRSKSRSTSHAKSQAKSQAKSHAKSQVKKVAVRRTQGVDTARATGGVQTGFGGVVAASSGSDLMVTLGLGAGAIFLLTAAAGVAPIRRRSEG